MTTQTPMLHILCGKIASGKSTLAARLAKGPGAVVVAEDDWLHRLFADDLKSLADYVQRSRALRRAMAPHLAALLNAGLSVVLDFPANTVAQRRWCRGILDQTSACHTLHLLAVSDAVCLARLRDRNGRRDHPFQVTEAQFHELSSHFVPPQPTEGFRVVTHAHGRFDGSGP